MVESALLEAGPEAQSPIRFSSPTRASYESFKSKMLYCSVA
jgi:hypothetical protein